MKNILFALLLSFIASNVFAQGLAVNGTGATADGSAMLDVSATNKGLLMPRMTLTQRTAIATPATGLLVYQTDGLTGFYYNAGTPAVPNWIRLSAENYWTLNGSNNIYNNNSGGFVGIGTTTPAERFHLSGTESNIATFNGGNQMYITLSENNAPKGYIGSFNQSVTVNDVDFGTHGSNSTGALHLITQSTPRITVTNTGNVGIGTVTPNAPLQLANDNLLNRKFVIWELANNNHQYAGFSGNGFVVRYQAPSVTASHVFYSALSGTSSQELVRITGAGNVGIGNSSPNAPLQFNTSLANRKIVLYDDNNNDHQYYGFGINGGTLRYQVDAAGADHVFFAGASAGSSNELMRITGTGNTGIGGITPNYRLDVNGRMRIRSIDATTNSAGLWLNASTNTERAFIGMENDNSVGFFGNNGAAWAFVMNTQTGKVRYQDGTQANGRVLTSDANGVASWTQLNSTQAVRVGNFGAGVNFDFSEMGSFPSSGTAKYTTASITLPPGRWVIIANLLINCVALPAGGGIFIRTNLTESAVSSVGTSDVVPGTGGLISGNFSYSNTFSFASGQILINNTTGANKTYYLWATCSRNGAAPATGAAVGAIGSSFWQENQLIAIPMN